MAVVGDGEGWWFLQDRGHACGFKQVLTTGLSLYVSNRVASPMVTTALKPTMLPGLGESPLVPTRMSVYCRPDAVVIVSPLPGCVVMVDG